MRNGGSIGSIWPSVAVAVDNLERIVLGPNNSAFVALSAWVDFTE